MLESAQFSARNHVVDDDEKQLEQLRNALADALSPDTRHARNKGLRIGGELEPEVSARILGDTARLEQLTSAAEGSSQSSLKIPEDDGIPRFEKQSRSLRILVADDSTINQKIVRLFIQKLGHTADLVGDGDEAVVVAQRNHYDLILMDLQMPKLDGISATRELRAVGYKQPIIALSASDAEKDRALCLEAGMNDFLSKPLMLEGLYAMLERYVFKAR